MYDSTVYPHHKYMHDKVLFIVENHHDSETDNYTDGTIKLVIWRSDGMRDKSAKIVLNLSDSKHLIVFDSYRDEKGFKLYKHKPGEWEYRVEQLYLDALDNFREEQQRRNEELFAPVKENE